MTTGATEDVRPPLARSPVLSAMAALGVVLAVTAGRYGFHRDELYFRALPTAWGHVDQPPLTPLLARAAVAVSDDVRVMRVPAVLFAVVGVLVVALITREVGGGRAAQGLAAWGTASGSFVLTFGHVLLTASLDLVVWPVVLLLVVRALLRDARWWVAAGAVIGMSTANKLLVVLLGLSLAVALLVAGPWRELRSRWLWAGVGVAAVTALPAIVYQAGHDWPQLAMGEALGRNNGDEVRAQAVPFLALLLGPPLVPVWVAGLVALVRRPAWRRIRLLAPALAVLVALTVAGGAQVYYPLGLLSAVFAVGCVPAAQWLDRTRTWRRLAVPGLVLNGAVSATLALPVLPLEVLGSTPVPDMNVTVADQVGWPTYVEQVARVHAGSGDPDAAVVTSNYGEYGAVVRFGPELGLPQPFSGHNALWDDGPPPDGTTTAVVVGNQLDDVRALFDECRVEAVLDDGVGVRNEEQDAPVAVCTGPVDDWSALWPRFRHLD